MNLELTHPWAVIYCQDDLTLVNNTWGFTGPMLEDSTQSIYKNEDTMEMGWRVNIPADHFDPAKVRSYPEAYIGTRDGDMSTNKPFDPILVKDIESMPVRADMHVTAEDDAQYNVAFETFLHSSPRPEFARTRMFELMVWMDKPSSSLLRYGTLADEVTINGVDYDVYIKSPQEGYIAYITKERQLPPYALDWSYFLIHAQTIFPNHQLGDLWLTALELGTEMWSGKLEVMLTAFAMEILEKSPEIVIDEGGMVFTAQSELYGRIAHSHMLICERHKELHDYFRELQKLGQTPL